MKIKISILTLFILVATASLAQEIKYGVKVGMNVSSLRGDFPVEINEKSKIGFHAGAFLEYAINEKLSIQPELIYSTQGGQSDVEKYDEALYYLGINPIPELTYLNLPILLKYEFINRLSIEFGPQIGYLLSAQTKLEYIDSSSRETVEIDILNGGNYTIFDSEVEIEPSVNRFDYGLNAGLSYELIKELFIQARYYLGIAVVDKTSARNRSSNYESKNSVLQFSLGYKF